MGDAESSGGRFIQFWTTLPGVLTAIAAVVTAVGGFYFASRGVESPVPSQPPEPGREITINLAGAGGTAPTVPQDVDESELNLTSFDESTSTEVDDEVSRALNDCANGDDYACGQVLDALVSECDEGYGYSCDVLYEVSAEGSDYEYFGATCGARVDPENAGSCSEL